MTKETQLADTVKGRRLQGGIRPSKRVDETRYCAAKDCETKLSSYNRREHCYTHAPVRFPRVRGRIIADGGAA